MTHAWQERTLTREHAVLRKPRGPWISASAVLGNLYYDLIERVRRIRQGRPIVVERSRLGTCAPKTKIRRRCTMGEDRSRLVATVDDEKRSSSGPLQEDSFELEAERKPGCRNVEY